MKKWMAVTGCILLLSGCAAKTEQEKSGIPITNIQVENYFNLGENVQYFSKVPSRVLVIGHHRRRQFWLWVWNIPTCGR